MVITIIRHAKVCYNWKGAYNSSEFDTACSDYDISCIVKDVNETKVTTNNKIFISSLQRTYDTGCLIFEGRDFLKNSLFNEVPLRSFTDTSMKLPIIVFNVLGRLQWLVNSKRQIETKTQTEKRAKEAIKVLEENKEDCYLICHGFFMRVLIKQLKLSGYKIKGEKKIGIDNLQRIILSK